MVSHTRDRICIWNEVDMKNLSLRMGNSDKILLSFFTWNIHLYYREVDERKYTIMKMVENFVRWVENVSTVNNMTSMNKASKTREKMSYYVVIKELCRKHPKGVRPMMYTVVTCKLLWRKFVEFHAFPF